MTFRTGVSSVGRGISGVLKGAFNVGKGLIDLVYSSHTYLKNNGHYARLGRWIYDNPRKSILLPAAFLAWAWFPKDDYNRVPSNNPSSLEEIVDDDQLYDERSDRRELGDNWNKIKVDKTGVRLRKYVPLIKESNIESVIENAYGSNFKFGLSLARCESSLNPGAVSKVGAAGLFQLMVSAANEIRHDVGGAKEGFDSIPYPQTYKGLFTDNVYTEKNPIKDPRFDWRFDPRKSAVASYALLKKWTREFGSLNSALAAYNWGPNNIRRIYENLALQGVKRPDYAKDIYPELPGKVKYFVENVRGTEKMYDMGFPLDKFKYHSSGYGNRINPFTKRRQFHAGHDFAAPTGTPVRACVSGIVTYAGWKRGYGQIVEVTHLNSPYKMTYGHLSKINVRKGRKVSKGSVIGKVGQTGDATGPHLDWKCKKRNYNGKYNSINPMQFLDRRTPSYDLTS